MNFNHTTICKASTEKVEITKKTKNLIMRNLFLFFFVLVLLNVSMYQCNEQSELNLDPARRMYGGGGGMYGGGGGMYRGGGGMYGGGRGGRGRGRGGRGRGSGGRGRW